MLDSVRKSCREGESISLKSVPLIRLLVAGLHKICLSVWLQWSLCAHCRLQQIMSVSRLSREDLLAAAENDCNEKFLEYIEKHVCSWCSVLVVCLSSRLNLIDLSSLCTLQLLFLPSIATVTLSVCPSVCLSVCHTVDRCLDGLVA